MTALNEATECRQRNVELCSQLEQAQLGRKKALRENAITNTKLIAGERAHAEQCAELEDKIEELQTEVSVIMS